ncbi:MAG: MFS transporter [Slackia sp.]|nr:MFS transporter [Slackia sp.]
MQGKPLVMLLCVLYGGAFLAGFNENLVNMALMSIMAEYAVDSITAQWLVTGYMIVATVVVTCMAFFYRRFKLRTLFFSAAALSFAGSIMGLFAPSFAFLLIARLVQAVGTGIFIPLMMNTILAVTPKNKLGTYMSIGSCMITFGPAFAPVVCGGIVTAFGWHNVFVVPAAAMAILAALGFFFVKNLEVGRAHLDLPSVALSSVALFALSFGLAELAHNTIAALASLAVAAIVTAVFIIRQLRCAHPLIDLSPAKSIRFWPTLLLATVAMMSTFSMSVLLPLYFEGALGTTAFFAGVVMLAPVLANTFITLLGGRIMDKHGEWPLLPIGFAITTAGFIVVAASAPQLSLPAMLVGSLITFSGVGLIFSPSQTAGLRTLSPEEHPFGVALSTTFVQIAACIGPSLYTGIMSSVQTGSLETGVSSQLACAQGFGAAMSVAAIVAGIGFLTAFAYALAAKKRTNAACVRQNACTLDAGLSAIMETDPYILHETDSVAYAMQAFVEKHVGGMPVVDENGRATGFLSDGDIMRHLAEQHPLIMNTYSLIALTDNASFDEKLRELMALPVKSVASSGLVAIGREANLEQACTLLAQHRLKKVPIMQDGKIIGTINRADIIRYAMSQAAGANANVR